MKQSNMLMNLKTELSIYEFPEGYVFEQSPPAERALKLKKIVDHVETLERLIIQLVDVSTTSTYNGFRHTKFVNEAKNYLKV